MPLRHSASFSCLPARDRPHRPRAGTLPADTDYGFVRPPPTRHPPTKKESFRDSLMKKSASILSPTAWWSQKPRRPCPKDVILEEPEEAAQQRRWRSLGALLRLPLTTTQIPPPASPRAQSFYLLDDFLPRAEQTRTAATSSSDSLELSSPLPPPVPPPPPPLRLLNYRDCSCRQCASREERASSNDTVCPSSGVVTVSLSLRVITAATYLHSAYLLAFLCTYWLLNFSCNACCHHRIVYQI